MGSGNKVVVNISSDEEVDTSVDRDYLGWLNKANVVGHYRKLNSPTQALEDDDCVILDSDPDKTTAVVDDDDDEVLVVGQKGEIACRDFPHPRHSCAIYSFNSTSHESYCNMCHCYVCDIPAPCPYWCFGLSSVDHCHANDKEKIWKNQREYLRTGIMPTQPSATTPAAVTRQISRSASQNIIRLSQNPLPPNQAGIRPCSSSSRVQQSILHNHGLQSLSNNNVLQKDRRSSYMGNLRSPVASSGTRCGTAIGNNIKAGLSTYAKGSQSIHHNFSSLVVPAEMYTQQQLSCAAVTGSQSNVYTQHPGQSKSVGGHCLFQANADQFAVPLTTTTLVSQAQTVQQQPCSNENVLQKKLAEVESWLMDSSNQAGLTRPEPVGRSPLTFDFETLNN